MPPLNEEDKARFSEKIDTAITILQYELADMMGHVSTRIGDGDRFLLRHLRPPMDPAIPVDDVLEFDLDGERVSGRREGRGKGFEIHFYTQPYKAFKDVGSVIHCHPPLAVALASVGHKVIGLQHRHKFKEVPILPWLYGSLPEHGERVAKALAESCAVVIEGHGAVVTGETLEEACVNMVHLERAAKSILLAAPLGKVRGISEEAVKQFESFVETRQTRSGRPLAEWRFYEHMIKRGERWSRL
jgi:L-fuculose-phosphate aldolase